MLCGGFCYAAEIENWLYYGLFAFFSTLVVYNGQRLFKSDQFKKTPWLSWVKRYERPLYILVILSAVLASLALVAVQRIEIMSLAMLGVAGIVSVFYVIKIRGRNMREIPYIKIHLIAISWTLVLIIFPILNEDVSISALVIGIAHYLYVLGITIPFDIRDLKYDLPSQKTIPQIFGVTISRILALMLLVAFASIMLMMYQVLWFNWLFHLSVLVQMGLIIFMNENRSDFYCAGWIDGAIILLGISYFTTHLV